MTAPFDLCGVSLDPATTLIEASAGTGKTFSITGLVVRLLLEQEVQLKEIVAVTFTEAATEELRDRVRRRIAEALDDLRTGRSDDPLLQRVLDNGDPSDALYRLNRALRSFDEAQIFTIHGFCQRCLNDYAFESGAAFDTNLAGDSTTFFEELARDFWRTRFWRQKQLLAALVIVRKQSPERWVAFLQRVARHPDMAILPPASGHSSAELTEQVEEAFAMVRAEWRQHKGQVEQILENDPGLSRSQKAFHPTIVADILENIVFCCEQFEQSSPECIAALDSVCSEAIVEGTKGKGTPPSHRFFELCSRFCQLVTTLFNEVAREFLAFAEMELPKRKARTNSITYDDLILGLRDALRHDRGAALASSVGRRYKAALIDEFQDTDAAQYEIFRTIFGTGQHCLFFIGDPKQAIYGFRGADIFTYREAARAAEARAFTLTTNWRSEPPLLAAMNTLFQMSSQPFVFDWIAYHEVRAPEKPRVVPLIDSDPTGAPLRFRLLKGGTNDRGCNQEVATKLVTTQLQADLAELLGREITRGAGPLSYRDCAVLVRSNREAQAIQAALTEAGIRNILRTDAHVFATEQAEEIQRLLQAVLEPRRDSLLKGALATSLFGLCAEDLYELEVDDEKRREWLTKFLDLQSQWMEGCFIAMFRRMLVQQSVRSRIVKMPGGERRLTNLLQLAELLHEAETAQHLAPDALCAFLDERRAGAGTVQEHHQLRLESDEDAVQIVTVHKAKGLEYPIVFCPFLWKPAESSRHEELCFHDRDHGNRITFDTRNKAGGEAKHCEWQSEETRSEELRLTYVALTRAMNRCYVYVPDAQKAAESPLGMLLAATSTQPMDAKLRSFVAASQGNAEVVDATGTNPPLPSRQPARSATLGARVLTRRIPDATPPASFSGLTKADAMLDRDTGNVQENEAPSADEAPTAPPNREPTIFTFPKGTACGNFFHDVLEQVDFAVPATHGSLISDKLRLHGIAEQKFAPVVASVLKNLGEVELAPGLRMSAVKPENWLRELEFTHPLKPTTPAALANLFSNRPDVDAAVLEHIGRLQFRPVEGFMRGFIDALIRWEGRVYIIDWKSNWLGSRPEEYGPARMAAVMLKHNYYLQYHLYALATDLFMRNRDPGYDYQRGFGGVFYVFLRGVDSRRPDLGIFHARPKAETIHSLRGLLP